MQLIRHVITRTMSVSSRAINQLQEDAKSIFAAAVDAVRPENLLRKHVRLEGNALFVQEKRYEIKKPCYVVGFGKAVYGMGVELEELLGDRIKEGICSVPKGIQGVGGIQGDVKRRIKYFEGAANNLPDAEAVNTARKILSLCEKLDEDDLLIVLISGGGSALLPLPKDGITLEEKLQVINELVKRGADIKELNCVRKKLSSVKGGGLAISAYPARVVSLILSDVIGDPVDVIASGPTVGDADGVDDALGVIRSRGAFVPRAVVEILSEVAAVEGDCSHVDNFIIGNNEAACSAAVKRAGLLGYDAVITDTAVAGDVEDIARNYAALTTSIISEGCKKPACVIAGGEPTVRLRGGGKGGRNQQLALALAAEFQAFDSRGFQIGFLSCGTDGIDGPTDAAGAFCYPDLFADARNEDLNAARFLRENDSYNFYTRFQNGRHLHKIGHTGTNVMDIHILLIK